MDKETFEKALELRTIIRNLDKVLDSSEDFRGKKTEGFFEWNPALHLEGEIKLPELINERIFSVIKDYKQELEKEFKEL